MKSKRLKLGQIDLQMCKDFDIIQAMDYDFQSKKILNKGRGFAIVFGANPRIDFPYSSA